MRASSRAHTFSSLPALDLAPSAHAHPIATITVFSNRPLQVLAQKNRYLKGLEKLEFAAQNVKTMQKELTDLQPVLKDSKEETNKLMEKIEAKLPGVQAKQKEVRVCSDCMCGDDRVFQCLVVVR